MANSEASFFKGGEDDAGASDHNLILADFISV